MSKEDYRRTLDRLIGEVWNHKNLDILSEVFTEDAVMHRGGPEDRGGQDMRGIPAFLDGYLRPTQTAFPDIQHEIQDLLFDGDRVVMRFHGEREGRIRSWIGVCEGGVGSYRSCRGCGLPSCRVSRPTRHTPGRRDALLSSSLERDICVLSSARSHRSDPRRIAPLGG